ncbi:MAG: hypothetical protein ACW991_01975 [Candidatus Hodarchaeales archaeon]|jgi:hypothetical protein
MGQIRFNEQILKGVLIGILIFLSTFFTLFFFFDVLISIPPPRYYIDSSIEIADLYAFDNNNDTKIDTISIDIANPGLRDEEIISIDFSMMNKSWNLTNLSYSIELSPTAYESVTLSAVANNDQICPDDEIYIEFYFLSKGFTKPAIILDHNDIVWEGESSFMLRNQVEFHKVYVDPELFVKSVLRFALVSLIISSLIFFIYLRRVKRKKM